MRKCSKMPFRKKLKEQSSHEISLAVTIKRSYWRSESWASLSCFPRQYDCLGKVFFQDNHTVSVCKKYNKEKKIFLMSMYDCLLVLYCLHWKVCPSMCERCEYLSQQVPMTWDYSVSIRPVLILHCILPWGLFLVDREQIWNLCLWFCDFWSCSLSKHEQKKGCGAKQAVRLMLVLAPESKKKVTGLVIMSVHGEAAW